MLLNHVAEGCFSAIAASFNPSIKRVLNPSIKRVLLPQAPYVKC